MDGATFLRTSLNAFDSFPGFRAISRPGNILATLKEDGKETYPLLSHMDVVPVEKERWEVILSGTVKDSYLYGRGTLDNKSMGIVEMMVLLILKREKVPLKRDILFFATADEETGGRWGVQWAMGNIPSVLESEFALNEGGYVVIDEAGRPDRYEVSSGQKVLYQVRLKVKGTSGHGSMPHSDNPNVKLVQALDRITRWNIPYNILPMVKEFFLKMAPEQPIEERKLFEYIERGLADGSLKTIDIEPHLQCHDRDTVS
jgi:acetylornithine deacetylase/succinyl-diaminopimelate desuccinylase-like protein